jgi:hypothetical protein
LSHQLLKMDQKVQNASLGFWFDCGELSGDDDDMLDLTSITPSVRALTVWRNCVCYLAYTVSCLLVGTTRNSRRQRKIIEFQGTPISPRPLGIDEPALTRVLRCSTAKQTAPWGCQRYKICHTNK